MEAHSTQVLNGIAGSMAAGLKKALSFEDVRLASQERVQQRLLPGLRCGDQVFKDFSQDRVQQRLVEPRATDGGSVGGSAEDGVSSGIQRRTAEQIVDLRGYRSAQDLVVFLSQSRRHDQRQRYNSSGAVCFAHDLGGPSRCRSTVGATPVAEGE